MTDPAAECLRALSVILDLANGLAEDKSALTAAFAARLSQEAGGDEAERRAAWYAALLRHLGCTAFASVEASLVTDDIGFRSRLVGGDAARTAEVAAALLASNTGGGAKLRGLAALARGAGVLRSQWTRSACDAARLLADQLALGPEVGAALDQVFERFDGTGPEGRGGEDLSRVGRIALVAHVAVVQWLAGGAARAEDVLRTRADRALDPTLAHKGLTLVGELDRGALAGAPTIPAAPVSIDAIAAAFGDFADLQTPGKLGHSRAVAALADRAATALGVPDDERRSLRWAAHLHDLGEVGLPTALWMVRRPFRPAERERVRLHPYLTERVLAGAEPLRSAARVAGSHHERLDGSGYHRGAVAAGIPRAARLLAAADAWCGMTEPRPHRPPLGRAAAIDALRTGAGLDPECVAAVLAAVGERGAKGGPPGLTTREVEVLKELALGRTNKEIAAALGISDRTVQHHTVNLYAKLGVSTRAGAALAAARAGLVG